MKACRRRRGARTLPFRGRGPSCPLPSPPREMPSWVSPRTSAGSARQGVPAAPATRRRWRRRGWGLGGRGGGAARLVECCWLRHGQSASFWLYGATFTPPAPAGTGRTSRRRPRPTATRSEAASRWLNPPVEPERFRASAGTRLELAAPCPATFRAGARSPRSTCLTRALRSSPNAATG